MSHTLTLIVIEGDSSISQSVKPHSFANTQEMADALRMYS